MEGLGSKGAPGVIACRPGLHGLQFEAWSQISDMPSNSGNMGEKDFQEFGSKMLTCPQLVGTWVKNIFRNLVPFFDMPSAVGTWVKNMFRNLVPFSMGEIYFQNLFPYFMGEKYFQEFGPIFYG